MPRTPIVAHAAERSRPVDDLFRIALSNAVAATFLALVALVIGRLFRRPAFTHALWLLVLIKLITPPLRAIEFNWPSAPEATTRPATPAASESANQPAEFASSEGD